MKEILLLKELIQKHRSKVQEIQVEKEEVERQSFKINPQPTRVDIPKLNDTSVAFGVIPSEIVEHLTTESDWKITELKSTICF